MSSATEILGIVSRAGGLSEVFGVMVHDMLYDQGGGVTAQRQWLRASSVHPDENTDLDRGSRFGPRRGSSPTPALDRREALWREHHLDLRRFCVAVAGVAHGDDIAVETFLRCADRILSGQVTSPRWYLRRAALNQVRTEARRRQRRARAEIQAEDRPVDDLGQPSEWSHVRAVVSSLTERQRAIVFLAYWEGLSEREIAEHLGIAHGTVRRHMHRAQQRIRSELT